jgi:hypothetical protein
MAGQTPKPIHKLIMVVPIEEQTIDADQEVDREEKMRKKIAAEMCENKKGKHPRTEL